MSSSNTPRAAEDDILIRLTVANRGPEAAAIHLLPTLWFRNTWSWGKILEDSTAKPRSIMAANGTVRAQHETLGEFVLNFEGTAQPLFTGNETNTERLFEVKNSGYVKDAFHRLVVNGEKDAVNPANVGTKFAAWYKIDIEPGASQVVRLRLSAGSAKAAPFGDFDNIRAAHRRSRRIL